MHTDEFFDPQMPDWVNTEIHGPLSGANQALSHIVFTRDLERFNRDYGSDLSLVHREYCLNSLRYLCSGGLNFRQLMPTATLPLLRGAEGLLSPMARLWSLHHMLVIKRM